MANTILVTGASGFVGSHLLNLLDRTAQDATLIAWRRPRISPDEHLSSPPRPKPTPNRVKWRSIDLLDGPSVTRAIAETLPTQVYHCAGVANVGGSWSNSYQTLRTNVMGTEHLLAALRNQSVATRVLVPGSALTYQPSTSAISETAPLRPVSPYGLSKLAQEMLALMSSNQRGVTVIVTRSFTHIGPGQASAYAASSFAEQIARIEAGYSKPVLRVGNLDARRDLTDVRDTVRAYQLLMANGIAAKPYNVCSGEAHKVRDVLDGLLAATAAAVSVCQDPARTRPSDNPLLLGDRTRITRDVGWHPEIPLSQTLTDLLDYWREVVSAQSSQAASR